MIEINWNPPPRDLRIFSLLLIAFFAVVAWGMHIKYAATTGAVIVAAAAALLGVVCFFVPAWARWIYVGWMLAVFPIGWTVSHILLAVVFYGVFTPFGLVMRLFGYDPLRRKFDPEADTYWIPRTESRRPEDYFRQY